MRGCSARRASRMSTISTGGSVAPSTRARQPQRGAARGSSRAAAWRCPRRAPRRSGARAAATTAARRSAGRPRACRSVSCSSSTITRPRSASGAKTAERGPTQTRASPLRSRAHSSWRSPAPSLECRTATVSPKRVDEARRRSAASAPISGTSTIALCPRSSASRDGAQVDLGLARAGDAVQQQPLAGRRAARIAASAASWSAVSGGGSARRAPTAACIGARRTTRGAIRTRPRASSRRSAARSRAGEARQRCQQRALARR